MTGKKQEVIEALLRKMFEYAGYVPPVQNLHETKSSWLNNYTMSNEAKARWINWGTSYLERELGLNRSRAQMEMQMVDLSFGLKSL